MERTRLVYVFTVVLLLICVLPMIFRFFDEASIRWALNRSVDMAFPMFWLAFAAGPLQRRLPILSSPWVLRNRRYLGICFGIAFLLHALLIYFLSVTYPENFDQPAPKVLFYGVLLFSITAFMLFTSNNLAVKYLTRPLWRLLHSLGGYFLLVVFLGAFVSNIDRFWLWPYLAASALLILLRVYDLLAQLIGWLIKMTKWGSAKKAV